MTKYISLAFAISMLVSPVVHAQPAADQVTINVRYDDLDLSKSAGVAALQRRIHVAARSICGDAPSVPDLAQLSLYRKCISTTELSAAGQMARVTTGAHTMVASR
jgi:UrcA family protein